MISRILLIVAVITSLLSLSTTENEIPFKKEVIVSPDSTDDITESKKEVEKIREAIHGEIPIPTFLQLRDTMDVRTKIKDAVSQRKYVQGASVPEDINVRLNANKEESSGGPSVLNLVNVVPEALKVDGDTKGIEDVDTSTKKDLSNEQKTNFLRPTFGWRAHRMELREKHEKPLVLKDPNIHTILKLPIWFKLRRGFVTNFFASQKV